MERATGIEPAGQLGRLRATIRGAIPRTELRAITAATYHQVWWPQHDDLVYRAERLPVWDPRAKNFTDPEAHQIEHLGIAGRRVLVSRKWSSKTLEDHRTERGEFVRQLLEAAGIQPTHDPDDGPCQWERPAPADPDIPARFLLLLRAVAERQRWKAEYTAAQLATYGLRSGNRSITTDHAA